MQDTPRMNSEPGPNSSRGCGRWVQTHADSQIWIRTGAGFVQAAGLGLEKVQNSYRGSESVRGVQVRPGLNISQAMPHGSLELSTYKFDCRIAVILVHMSACVECNGGIPIT